MKHIKAIFVAVFAAALAGCGPSLNDLIYESWKPLEKREDEFDPNSGISWSTEGPLVLGIGGRYEMSCSTKFPSLGVSMGISFGERRLIESGLAFRIGDRVYRGDPGNVSKVGIAYVYSAYAHRIPRDFLDAGDTLKIRIDGRTSSAPVTDDMKQTYEDLQQACGLK